MKRCPGATEGEQGFALAQALLLAVVAVMVASLLAQGGATMAGDTVAERGHLRAHFAAEAGLAKARHALGRGEDFRGADLRVDRCDVEVRVRSVGAGSWTLWSRAVSYPRGQLGLPVVVILREGFGADRWFATGPER